MTASRCVSLSPQHGRLKVKTTAQQEEEKKRERERKLKLYVAARDACFSKVCWQSLHQSCVVGRHRIRPLKLLMSASYTCMHVMFILH